MVLRNRSIRLFSLCAFFISTNLFGSEPDLESTKHFAMQTVMASNEIIPDDKKSCRLVSRSWNAAYLTWFNKEKLCRVTLPKDLSIDEFQNFLNGARYQKIDLSHLTIAVIQGGLIADDTMVTKVFLSDRLDLPHDIFKNICHLNALEVLYIDGTNLSVSMIEDLKPLVQLKEIDVSGAQLTPLVFEAFQGLPSLEYLRVGRTNFIRKTLELPPNPVPTDPNPEDQELEDPERVVELQEIVLKPRSLAFPKLQVLGLCCCLLEDPYYYFKDLTPFREIDIRRSFGFQKLFIWDRLNEVELPNLKVLKIDTQPNTEGGPDLLGVKRVPIQELSAKLSPFSNLLSLRLHVDFYKSYEFLSHLVHLEDLSIKHFKLPDNLQVQLDVSCFPSLRSLTIGNIDLLEAEDFINQLPTLLYLSKLNFESCLMDITAIPVIANCKGLEGLRLNDLLFARHGAQGLDNQKMDLNELISLVHLRQLSLQNAKLVNEDLSLIGRFLRLEKLNLKGNPQLNGNYLALANLQHLWCLDLGGTSIDESAFALFPRLRSLRKLNFEEKDPKTRYALGRRVEGLLPRVKYLWVE